MHFASRLGLDLQSVRGIPEKKQMTSTDTAAKLKQVDVARLAQLEALVASLTARLTEAEEVICTLIDDVAGLTSGPSSPTKAGNGNGNSPTKSHPWVALGMSKSAYYRRKAAGQLKEN